jgi:transcriptional regulator with XRE-family HTH domain
MFDLVLLANNIKKFREERNWSQRRLAMYVGISNTEIAALENRRRKKPNLEILIKIDQSFNLKNYNDLWESGIQIYNSETELYIVYTEQNNHFTFLIICSSEQTAKKYIEQNKSKYGQYSMYYKRCILDQEIR